MAKDGTVPEKAERASGFAAPGGEIAAPDQGVFALDPASSSGLGRQLAERMRSDGPLTFGAFMEAALYDPSLGYYRRGVATMGRDGDYLTSAEIDPLFGYAIGSLAASVWEAMERPERFVLRDVGGGSGALMESALRWAAVQRPAFAEALWGEIVERSAPDRERQGRRLGPLGERVTWVEDVAVGKTVGEPVRGLIVANELLDAQPVHRLQWDGERWQELYVGLSAGGGFEDQSGPVSDAVLLAPLAEVVASDGQIVEVCPTVEPLVAALATTLEAGVLALFDYGYRRERLYASWRRRGTLMTFYRHTAGEDPYQRVGEQDLTAHVDVDAVLAAGLSAGLSAYEVQSQAEFLSAVGAAAMESVAEGTGAGGRGVESYLSRRRAVEMLTDPGGLGRIQVMAFGRGLDAEIMGLGAAFEEAGT
jgi:SAM-dependent MidA family methyltransferase